MICEWEPGITFNNTRDPAAMFQHHIIAVLPIIEAHQTIINAKIGAYHYVGESNSFLKEIAYKCELLSNKIGNMSELLMIHLVCYVNKQVYAILFLGTRVFKKGGYNITFCIKFFPLFMQIMFSIKIFEGVNLWVRIHTRNASGLRNANLKL